MILVKISKAGFEYDIHSLVKAFFPKEEIIVTAEDKALVEEPLYILEISYETGTDADIIHVAKGENRTSIETDFSQRVKTKNRLKQAIYQVLSEYTKTTLPWGTLTGIRPTKIPMNFLEEGKSEDWIRTFMQQTYEISPQKTTLSISVAKRERQMLGKIDYEEGYSLYIGIPFCPSTCLYCSFPSYPIGKFSKEILENYLEALEKEMEFTAKACAHRKLNTIYFGGGTPTTLSAEQLDRLFTKLAGIFDFTHLKEYTVEAGRPDSITKDKLEVMKKHNISRISINPQTMKQETLDLIGRNHTVAQTKESFWLARSLGFDNINMDLIVGLPEENRNDVQNTMEQLKALEPDSITVHSLAIKRAARLRMFKEEYEDLKIVNTSEIIDLTAAYAKEAGLFPYYLYRQKNMAGNFENVGYAKQGKEGLYNILIMEEKQTILALGAGAITKFVPGGGERITRTENVKDIQLYIERLEEMIERKRIGIEKYMRNSNMAQH